MENLKLLSMFCLLWLVGLVATAKEISNNEIWYEAEKKLPETNVSDHSVSGLHINAFNAKIVSHEFKYPKGVIRFESDVTSIGEWAFFGCGIVWLYKITFPNSITSIASTAFGSNIFPDVDDIKYADTYMLGIYTGSKSTYNVKDGTKWIGANAFKNCSFVTSVSLPNSLMYICNNAFIGCSGLTSINIPNSVISIENGAFSGCENLTSINIPDSITTIQTEVFRDCSSLPSIEIPNSVTSIGGSAFNGCSSLSSIEIPNSVTSIGSGAFMGCSSLSSIEIPNSVTSIEDWTFSGCNSLTSMTIPNSVTSIGQFAFNGCKGLTSITIPNSVTRIGWSVFYGCTGLTSITIPKSVTSIEREAFYGCTGLTSITIPNSVTSIGSGAFYGCTGLTSITIPNSVTSIGSGAFMGCSSLTSITIPKSVTNIDDWTFKNCNSLTSIKVQWNRPLSIPSEVFNGVDKSACTLYVPKGTSQMYMAAPVWIEFVNIQEYSDGEDECVVTLKQGDGGCIKDVVEVGKTAQYIISPADGWSINSVSFNGADVTNQLTDGRFTTPVITGNSELNVVFKQGGSRVKDLTNSSFKILASNGSVTISGNDLNERICVYSVGGSEVATNSGNCMIQLPSGVYIIKVGEEVFKVAI